MRRAWHDLSAGDKAVALLALLALLLAVAIGAVSTALVDRAPQPAPALLELRPALK